MYRKLLVLLLLLLLAAPVLADWSHDADENDLVCSVGAVLGQITTCPDGEGGLYVAWLDSRDGATDYEYDLYMQHFDATGARLWSRYGQLIHAGRGYLTGFELVQDGVDGCYVVFRDYEATATYRRGYAQCILSDGSLPWGTDALDICPGDTDLNVSGYRAVLTARGDLAVAYSDGSDVYAQRIATDGLLRWGDNGLTVCAATLGQSVAGLVALESDHIVCLWLDDRDTEISNQLYAQRLDAGGNASWTAGGELMPSGDNTGKVLAEPDGQDGALVAWRMMDADDTLYYAHLISSASPEDLSAHAVYTGDSVNLKSLVCDPYGGGWLLWDAMESYYYTCRLQHLDRTGDEMLDSGGVEVMPSSSGSVKGVRLFPGDGDEVYAVFYPSDNNYDLRAHRVAADGTFLWGDDGLLVSSSGSFPQGVDAVGLGDRFYAVWADRRNWISYDFDLYGQMVDRSGRLGDPSPGVLTAADAPNDQGGVVELAWFPSYLDAYGEDGLDRYSVWRRNGGTSKAAAPVDAAELAARSGLGLEDAATLLTAGWIYEGDATPYHFTEYGYLAASFGDATDEVTPLSEYMVMAHDAEGNWWESDTAATSSVDNLSPGAPLALAALMVEADARLGWEPSGVLDEDLSHYNVFRGATSDFEPDAAAFVGTTADTVYVDAALPGGDWYYRVTAVDLHGNESDASNLALVQSLTGADDLPGAFVVRGAYPNPFNPSTTIRFDLPGEARTRVEVLDMRGRRVRTLLDASLGGGAHAVPWDGRDDAGRSLPSGTYFARVTADSRVESVKLLLAK